MGRKSLLMWLMCCLLLDVSRARSIEVLPPPSTWTPEFVVGNLERIIFGKPEGSSELKEVELFEVTLHNNTVIVPDNGVPRSVYEAFVTMDDQTKRDFMHQEFSQSDSLLFGNMPVLLLYILPEGTLNSTPSRHISSAVRENFDNVAVAEKLVESIGNSTDRQNEFLMSLDTKISTDVQNLLMTKVTKWWPNPRDWKTRLSLLVDAGDIMLASIPTNYLKSIPEDALTMFIEALASAPDIKTVWKQKMACVKKCWYDAALRAKYVGPLQLWDTKKTVRNSFLLEAAPADLLRTLRFVDEDQRRIILAGSYSDMQIRALFDALYAQTNPTVEELREFDQRVFSLYPEQLLQFPFMDGEFRFVTKNYGKKDFYFHPSVLQLAYFLYPLQEQRRVENWGARELSEIGPLIHTLPIHELNKINSAALDWRQRSTFDIASRFLTISQTWLLMEKIQLSVDSRRDVPNYLRFIPAPLHQGIPTGTLLSSLMLMPDEEIFPILVTVFDGMLPSQQQLIYQELRNRLGDAAVLKSILETVSDSLLNMLTPNKTIEVMTRLMQMRQESLDEFVILRKQEKAIKQMPRRTLSIWLNHIRNELKRDWMAEDFLPRTADLKYRADYAILGLTCGDVEMMGDLQLIHILSKYRKVLAAVKKTKDVFFPIDLMHCMLKRIVMDFHLTRELKGSLSSKDASTLLLITQGEAMELGPTLLLISESELVAVPPMTRRIIIEAIGTVDVPTLLSVANISKLQWLAQQYIQDSSGIGEEASMKTHLFHNMGTLFPFCTPETNVNLEAGALREYLEMHQDEGDKMFCLGASLQTFWQGIIEKEFGSPKNWTGSDIVLMGDLLLWLSNSQLENIPEMSTIDAFDVWLENLAISRKLIQRPGRLVSMMEACHEEIGSDGGIHDAFNKMARKMIIAASAVVDTVKTPRDLVQGEAARPRPRRQAVARPETDVPIPASGRPIDAPPAQSLPDERQFPPPAGNERSQFPPVPGNNIPQFPPAIGNERAQFPPMPADNRPQFMPTFTPPLTPPTGNVRLQFPQDGRFQTSPPSSNFQRPDMERPQPRPDVIPPARTDLRPSEESNFRPAGERVLDQPGRNQRLFPIEQENAPLAQPFGEGINVTCETLKTIGPLITVVTKEEFFRLSHQDFTDCLEFIGAHSWNKPTAMSLFGMLKIILDQGARRQQMLLPPKVLLTLGTLAKEIIGTDLDMVNFQLMAGMDTVAIMGRHTTNIREMELLATKFLGDNSDFISNVIESRPAIRAVVLAALGNIAGGLPPREIMAILNSQQGMYWELSPLLGKLTDATPAVLAILAEFAVAEYGDPSFWTEHTVETVGIVMAGMRPDSLMLLGRKRKGLDPLQGLTVSSIKIMPAALLQSMTEDQLASLPLSVALSVTENQKRMLSPMQKEALRRAFEIPSFIPSESNMVRRFDVAQMLETTTAMQGSTTESTTTGTPTTTQPPQEAAQERSSGHKYRSYLALLLLAVPMQLF